MYEDLFYKRLQQLRYEKGVSAREMSLDIGQNSGYINRLDKRQGLPSMSTFFYICEYLGITPKEFFDEQNIYPAQVHEMMDILQSLDKEKLDTVYDMLKLLGEK